MTQHRTNDASDWIYLSFPCVLGMTEWEQRESQTLELELGMGLDLDPAACGDLRRSVDYSATLEQVQFIAQHGRWLLLESVAAAMARVVLAPPAPGEQRAQVRSAVVRVRKPEVFRGRAVPTVEIWRDESWYEPRELVLAAEMQRDRTGSSPAEPAARIEILLETRETGAYRIHLLPGQQWTVPAGMAIQVVSGRVSTGTEVLALRSILTGGGQSLSTSADAPSCLLGVSQPPIWKSQRW